MSCPLASLGSVSSIIIIYIIIIKLLLMLSVLSVGIFQWEFLPLHYYTFQFLFVNVVN